MVVIACYRVVGIISSLTHLVFSCWAIDFDRFNFEFGIWRWLYVCYCLLQGSGNNFFLNTFGFFLLVFGQILAGDALARFLNHVRVGSKTRTGHDAPLRCLEVSSCLSIEVTTEPTRSSSQQRICKDLDMFTTKYNHDMLLDSMDCIVIVFKPLDMQNFQTIMTDNLHVTRQDLNNLLLAIQVQLNLHVGSRNRSHENLSNTSKNLNFLGDSLKIPSHDSNRDLFSAISEEKVEAVVQFIVVHLAIKGVDVGR